MVDTTHLFPHPPLSPICLYKRLGSGDIQFRSVPYLNVPEGNFGLQKQMIYTKLELTETITAPVQLQSEMDKHSSITKEHKHVLAFWQNADAATFTRVQDEQKLLETV